MNMKAANSGLAPPGTPCPLWLTFLHRVTGGDEELVGFLKRWCGYCLTGVTTEQVLGRVDGFDPEFRCCDA